MIGCTLTESRREIDIMLTMKYDRKDFFGNRQYAEDSKDNYGREDVKKAFLHLGKDRFSSLQKEGTVYFWENTEDFENRIMTVRIFDKVNVRSYGDKKMAFDKVKKECYASVQ